MRKGIKCYTYYYDQLLGPFDKIENKCKSLLLYNGTAFKILNLDRGYKLYDNISYVQDLLQQNNIDINLTTPIVPIIVHSNEKALQIAQKLYEKHII